MRRFGCATLRLLLPRASALSLLMLVLACSRTAAGEITDIKAFLDQCPTDDPIYDTLRSDIQLRRNGVLVGDIPCTAPVSQMPVSDYTDELIVVQALRTIYYMDRDQSGHLSWTPGPMYEWLISKIGGIDIRDDSLSFCCESFDGRTFISVAAQDAANRSFDKEWQGISGNIALYGHETRHVDGFPHSSCCGIPGGCDDTFDNSNPSAYAIQYLLNKYWLEGTIDVGISCQPPSDAQTIAYWHYQAGEEFRSRFCTNAPPSLTIPATPGGPCMTTDVPASARGRESFLSEGKPNPFRGSTRIDFTVPRTGHVVLRIYDVAGHQVGTLVDEVLTAGVYSRSWDATGLPAGAYFYRLQAGGVVGSRKLMLLR